MGSRIVHMNTSVNKALNSTAASRETTLKRRLQTEIEIQNFECLHSCQLNTKSSRQSTQESELRFVALLPTK
jgi:hypothetical protein